MVSRIHGKRIEAIARPVAANGAGVWCAEVRGEDHGTGVGVLVEHARARDPRNVLVLAETAVPGRTHDLHRLMEDVAAEQGARALRRQANSELAERMPRD